MANEKLQNMTHIDWKMLRLQGLPRKQIQFFDRLGAFYTVQYTYYEETKEYWPRLRLAYGDDFDHIMRGEHEFYIKEGVYIRAKVSIENIHSFDGIENADTSLIEDYFTQKEYAKLQFLVAYLKGEKEGPFDVDAYKESERNEQLLRRIYNLESKLHDVSVKNDCLMEQISQYKKEIKELSKVKNLLIKSHKALGDAISDLD